MNFWIVFSYTHSQPECRSLKGESGSKFNNGYLKVKWGQHSPCSLLQWCNGPKPYATWKYGPCSLSKCWDFNLYWHFLIDIVTTIFIFIQTHFKKFQVCWGTYLIVLPSQQQLAALLNIRAKIMASFYFRWSELSVQAHKGTSSANVEIKPLLCGGTDKYLAQPTS